MRHDIVANHTGPARAMWAGGAAEFRRTAAGPATVLRASDQTLFRAAVIAAAVWNQYLPAVTPKLFNVTAAALPGSTVGQIWIPCPNNVCNVTIDPSYSAPVNVLIHEIGHGLGLPEGATSGIGTTVGPGNHWVPEATDPREIMTATLHEAPYLSMYTITAMDPYNHTACRESYECRGGMVCYPTGVIESPGVCDAPGGTIINRYHYPEYGYTAAWAALLFGVLLLGTLAVAAGAVATAPGGWESGWW